MLKSLQSTIFHSGMRLLIYMYIYIYIYICICIYVYVYIYIYLYTYVCIYICVCVCVCIHVYIFIYIYVYVYMYVYRYTYTYVCMYITRELTAKSGQTPACLCIHRQTPACRVYTDKHPPFVYIDKRLTVQTSNFSALHNGYMYLYTHSCPNIPHTMFRTGSHF